MVPDSDADGSSSSLSRFDRLLFLCLDDLWWSESSSLSFLLTKSYYGSLKFPEYCFIKISNAFPYLTQDLANGGFCAIANQIPVSFICEVMVMQMLLLVEMTVKENCSGHGDRYSIGVLNICNSHLRLI